MQDNAAELSQPAADPRKVIGLRAWLESEAGAMPEGTLTERSRCTEGDF
jgi:hypothetical protein